MDPRAGRLRRRRLFPACRPCARAQPAVSAPAFRVGPLKYIGQAQAQTDIENMRAALEGVKHQEAVLTAIAPGTIKHWLHNEYYKTDEEFLFAITEAVNEEYRAITEAEYVLQIDDPDLADAWQTHADFDIEEYRAFADLRVESINVALKGVPRESVRLYVCCAAFTALTRTTFRCSTLPT